MEEQIVFRTGVACNKCHTLLFESDPMAKGKPEHPDLCECGGVLEWGIIGWSENGDVSVVGLVKPERSLVVYNFEYKEDQE